MTMKLSEFESELKSALVDFQSKVENGEAANLGAALEKVMQLSQSIPEGVHPQLIHYLQRRSYNKAIQWLNGEDPDR